MFHHLYNVFKDGEYVTGYDNAVELRRFMLDVYEDCEYHPDIMEEWQVLMTTKMGVFW